MRKIFLDTNFIIDYLIRDEYRESSRAFLEKGVRAGCLFCISYLSVANFAYVARKLPRKDLDRCIRTILELFVIIVNDKTQIEKAICLDTSDFEDALQYQCAKEVKCECIITRNQKDFLFSEIPVLTAAEYMEKYL